MNPINTGKLRQIGEFCLVGALAGIIFQLIKEERIDHNALILGIFLGLGFGIIELFILSGLRKKLLTLPFLATIGIKAFGYLIIINLVSGLLVLIIGIFQGKQMEDFYTIMFGKYQLILNIYGLVLYALLSFHVQINLLLGEGILIKFLLGKYRRPKREHRIFMFLDLKSDRKSVV